ncbi:BACON domain-containing protein [uncultured Alistipes sp.]|uniref:BACON domain-containing protein n=1 Tax=uncultured Alistipes sp. TaxID=538949 RepID=UPI002600DBC2|nr:BACON domain-containing protein [uncultured Alistipes sp.]
MKKTFLHLLLLSGCVCLLASCIEDKAEDAAHRLVVSKADVELIQTGTLNTGSKASLDVLANRGYVITSDAEWLGVDKPVGKGRVSVTLEAKPNETAGERTGHLTVTSGKLTEKVTVTQTLDPDPDDGNPVGYVYYLEDFDWIAVYGGADCVGVGSQDGAKNIYSTGDALQKFGQAGLEDYNPVGRTMYACAGYFKMGATDKQTGIILPALKIDRKKASNVELTFEACPNIGGSGKVDAVTVTVEIVEGPGTVNGNSDRKSEGIKPDQAWKWTPMSVKLYGVTAATRIVIRSTQQGDPGVTAGEKGLFRWYLDNVKIVKAPRN